MFIDDTVLPLGSIFSLLIITWSTKRDINHVFWPSLLDRTRDGDGPLPSIVITVTRSHPCPTIRHSIVIQVAQPAKGGWEDPRLRVGWWTQNWIFEFGARAGVPPAALLGSARVVCACGCRRGHSDRGRRPRYHDTLAPVMAGATSRCHESLARPRSGPGSLRLAANHGARVPRTRRHHSAEITQRAPVQVVLTRTTR